MDHPFDPVAKHHGDILSGDEYTATRPRPGLAAPRDLQYFGRHPVGEADEGLFEQHQVGIERQCTGQGGPAALLLIGLSRPLLGDAGEAQLARITSTRPSISSGL